MRLAVAASDIEIPDTVVTRVAREAALLARAMVADAPEAVANLQREHFARVGVSVRPRTPTSPALRSARAPARRRGRVGCRGW